MIVYLARIFSSPKTSGFDLLICYLGLLIHDIWFSWTVLPNPDLKAILHHTTGKGVPAFFFLSERVPGGG